MKELPCAELFEDDGRRTNGEYHKGDWGSHSHADWIAENNLTDSNTKLVVDKTKTLEQK